MCWIVLYVMCLWLKCDFFEFFFFQAEDGIRDLVRSRGLGDVYKRQPMEWQRLSPENYVAPMGLISGAMLIFLNYEGFEPVSYTHLKLPTSDLV